VGTNVIEQMSPVEYGATGRVDLHRHLARRVETVPDGQLRGTFRDTGLIHAIVEPEFLVMMIASEVYLFLATSRICRNACRFGVVFSRLGLGGLATSLYCLEPFFSIVVPGLRPKHLGLGQMLLIFWGQFDTQSKSPSGNILGKLGIFPKTDFRIYVLFCQNG